MSTKRYNVRRESETDLKQYVKCIFAESEDSWAFSLARNRAGVTVIAEAAAPDEMNGWGCEAQRRACLPQ
jgi:hypothetical protein